MGGYWPVKITGYVPKRLSAQYDLIVFSTVGVDLVGRAPGRALFPVDEEMALEKAETFTVVRRKKFDQAWESYKKAVEAEKTRKARTAKSHKQPGKTRGKR